MAITRYRRTLLTSGVSAALDGIDGADLVDGDICDVFTIANEHYVYALDADSGTAESSPLVIAPDVSPGSKRWHLQNGYSAGTYFSGLWKIVPDGTSLVFYYYSSGWVEHSRLELPV